MSSTESENQAAGAQTVESESLLDQIMQETRYAPNQEGYDVARQGWPRL